MKTTTMILLLIAGGLTMQAAAASPDSNPSASTNLRQTTKRPFYEFWKPKAKPSEKIERYGRISSRPWAQSVGWSSPALFVDQRTYEPDMNYYAGGTSPVLLR